MSSAMDAAVVGAVTNNPLLARDMVQTATVGSIISSQDVARATTPIPATSAATLPATYGSGSPAYAAALANTSVQAQESLMTLASQNQLLETLMRSL